MKYGVNYFISPQNSGFVLLHVESVSGLSNLQASDLFPSWESKHHLKAGGLPPAAIYVD